MKYKVVLCMIVEDFSLENICMVDLFTKNMFVCFLQKENKIFDVLTKLFKLIAG